MTIEPPFFKVLTGTWVGEKPPRRSPDYPCFRKCGGEAEIGMHRHYDSDGVFHEGLYRCLKCGARARGIVMEILNFVQEVNRIINM